MSQPTFVTFENGGHTHWVQELTAFQVVALCGRGDAMPVGADQCGPTLSYGLLRTMCPRCRSLAMTEQGNVANLSELSLTPV